MKRGTLLWVCAAMAGAASAAADPAPTPSATASATYDQLARSATPLSYADLEGLAWALTAACDQGDDVARRECRWVRDARLAKARGQTFAIGVDKGALVASAWDPAGQVTVSLRGCVACTFAVEIGGAKLHVVAGAPMVEGNAVSSAVASSVPRPFSSEAAAERWRTEVLPRLRTQLLVRVPAGEARWKLPAGEGLGFELVGFRVVDPCSGAVVMARPESEPVTGDPAICGKSAAPADGERKPRLPDSLSSADIRAALAPAETAAAACFESFGVAGEARFRISISDLGAIVTLEQEGDFVDTPTGACIEKAVRAAVFPRTKRARTTIAYPIVLR